MMDSFPLINNVGQIKNQKTKTDLSLLMLGYQWPVLKKHINGISCQSERAWTQANGSAIAGPGEE